MIDFNGAVESTKGSNKSPACSGVHRCEIAPMLLKKERLAEYDCFLLTYPTHTSKRVAILFIFEMIF